MKRKLLKRNDLAGARLFYEQNKPITSSMSEMLLMMQDDPTELLKIMKSEAWQIVKDADRPPNVAQRLMGK